MTDSTLTWLARHGETVGTVERRYGGAADFPLSDLGREQAAVLREQVMRAGLTVVVTSPLQRATQTAEIVTSGRPGHEMIVVDGLQEWNSYGVLSGLRRQEATDLFPALMKALHGRPEDTSEHILGAEPVASFRRRVLTAWSTCLSIVAERPSVKCLVIMHGKFLQELVIALGATGTVSYEPCALHLLQCRPTSCRVGDIQRFPALGVAHTETEVYAVRIYLVRHGESQDDIDGEYGGAADHQLTSRGAEQARTIGSTLKAKGIRRIYTSPLRRASASAAIVAEILGLQSALRVVSDLRERNSYGVLSGIRKERASDLFPLLLKPGEVRSGYDKTPLLGAEDFDDFLKRVASVFADVVGEATTDGVADFALVSHGTFLKALVTEHLRLDLPADWSHGSALLLEYTPAAATISTV